MTARWCQGRDREIIFIKLVAFEALASLTSPFSLKEVVCQLVMHLTLKHTDNRMLARRIGLQRCVIYADSSANCILCLELGLLLPLPLTCFG